MTWDHGEQVIELGRKHWSPHFKSSAPFEGAKYSKSWYLPIITKPRPCESFLLQPLGSVYPLPIGGAREQRNTLLCLGQVLQSTCLCVLTHWKTKAWIQKCQRFYPPSKYSGVPSWVWSVKRGGRRRGKGREGKRSLKSLWSAKSPVFFKNIFPHSHLPLSSSFLLPISLSLPLLSFCSPRG